MGTKEPPKPSGKGRGDFSTSASPFSGKASPYTCEVASYSFVGQMIDYVLARGDAIIFGTTRDGGALVITVCEGDQRHKTYCHSDVELNNALTYVHDMYDPS